MKTRVIEENLVTPYIEISNYAMDKIRYIVEQNDMEIGWLGFVDTIDDKSNPHHYKIIDVVITKQHRHGTTCELDEDGYDELVHEIVDKFKDDEDEEADIKMINKILFWGHSHVNMGTSPSGQDEVQAKKFAKKGKIIRGIFNKKGEINLSFFDFAKNIAWDDLTLHMESALTAEDKAKLDEDMKSKVALKDYKDEFGYGAQSTYTVTNSPYSYNKSKWAGSKWVYDKTTGSWYDSSVVGNTEPDPIVKASSVVHPRNIEEERQEGFNTASDEYLKKFYGEYYGE